MYFMVKINAQRTQSLVLIWHQCPFHHLQVNPPWWRLLWLPSSPKPALNPIAAKVIKLPNLHKQEATVNPRPRYLQVLKLFSPRIELI